MNKPIVFSIVGAAAIGAVIWLAMRANDPGAPAKTAAADASAPATLAHPEDNASEASNSATSATVPAATATDGVAPPTMTRDAASPLESHGATLPIDASPGFEYLAKPATEMDDTDSQWTQWRRHQQLQSEPRDDDWAPRMEAEFRRGIQDSLTAAGLDTQRIELSVLECRSHGCEIQAVGYQQDNMHPKADLQSIVPSLLSGPMADEFDLQSMVMSIGPRADGRMLFLMQIRRKKS